MHLVLHSQNSVDEFETHGGGKALNMARMSHMGLPIPHWFCVGAEGFRNFLTLNKIEIDVNDSSDLSAIEDQLQQKFADAPLPEDLSTAISNAMKELKLEDRYVAVRSSGMEEDSADSSFAGQFSSYLFQKGMGQVEASLKLCWASAFSQRALTYRRERGLPLENIQMGVVIQLMVDSRVSGVSFSRNPIHPLDRETMVIESVYGLGEGLVSGALDADHYQVNRDNFKYESNLAEKEEGFYRAESGGLHRQKVESSLVKAATLSAEEVKAVAKMTLKLEQDLGGPQDCEWGFEGDTLFFLQTRPITTLPPDAFFADDCNRGEPTLWDNSNIIESYSGVTLPLTFSFASNAYMRVYYQFCEMMGVPQSLIDENQDVFRNLLGHIRGRIYYHLIHWYKLVLLLPGSSSNSGFLDTMMGVRQELKPELASLFDFINNPPKYSRFKRLRLLVITIIRMVRINQISDQFQNEFNRIYDESRHLNFKQLSLPALKQKYLYLDREVLGRWKAPIINDYLCMIFFGILSKLTKNWVVGEDDKAGSLQNDLLCGEGDLKSTEPTKMLMRISKEVDQDEKYEDTKEMLLKTPGAEVWDKIRSTHDYNTFFEEIETYIDLYGFRCVEELKLETMDLHDDPTFIINAISSYVQMKSYSIEDMEKREQAIRSAGENEIRARLSGFKRIFYFWILKHTRSAVKRRENLRFDRTKIFGVSRHLFRGMGHQLVKLGVLEEEHDIFYLCVEEIIGFIEGRSVSINLNDLAQLRKKEYQEYEETMDPPDRFYTEGAVGAAEKWTQILTDSDLLASEIPENLDPNTLIGTPCCPGIVEGVVRVAKSLKDAENMKKEILVTGRTDPGWVPLYPSCAGLLIERGSLLSHSAVVARELGLPTIVGVQGGLMKKLKTGMKVRVDAAKGEIKILPDD